MHVKVLQSNFPFYKHIICSIFFLAVIKFNSCQSLSISSYYEGFVSSKCQNRFLEIHNSLGWHSDLTHFYLGFGISREDHHTVLSLATLIHKISSKLKNRKTLRLRDEAADQCIQGNFCFLIVVLTCRAFFQER